MALRTYSNQGELWGPSPDLALPAGHPARAVDEIIESLNLDRCNRKHRHTPGEPAYDVRGTVKILIYAYMRGITSSREMARQCEENIAFQFLTRGQCPDFRTIARFRRKKRHLLRWVFKKTESGKAIYEKRKAIIEPIFWRWQHNWGIRRLRLRGLAGFSVELHLMAIAHNLTKLFRLQQNWTETEAAA